MNDRSGDNDHHLAVRCARHGHFVIASHLSRPEASPAFCVDRGHNARGRLHEDDFFVHGHMGHFIASRIDDRLRLPQQSEGRNVVNRLAVRFIHHRQHARKVFDAFRRYRFVPAIGG